MHVLTRPVRGPGRHTSTWHVFNAGSPQIRPRTGRLPTVALSIPGAAGPANISGPRYLGMDPSDPLTYVRQWNPQPGMIGYLNFDGAQQQGRTPTQVQRGRQQRAPMRLRVGM